MASTPTPTLQGVKRKYCQDDQSSTSTPPPPSPKRRPSTKECAICAETKPNFGFAFPQPDHCAHGNDVCKSCLEEYIHTKIESNPAKGWEACECPLCGTGFGEEFTHYIVGPQDRGRLEAAIKSARDQQHPKWLWCQAPGCGHGEVHSFPKNRRTFIKVKCSKCKAALCMNHRSLWHEGETCLEHDINNPQSEQAKADALEIQRTTKACPYCKYRINKDGGCNHMVCNQCRRSWLWDNVPFDGHQVATTAETMDEEEGEPALEGEMREIVEATVQADNEPFDFEAEEVEDDAVEALEAIRAGQGAQTWLGAFEEILGAPHGDAQAPTQTPRPAPIPAWMLGLQGVIEEFVGERLTTAEGRFAEMERRIDNLERERSEERE